MARPTKLDDRTQNLILVGVRLGLTYTDAAQAAGVSYRTFARWVQKGQTAKSGKFWHFCHALERAKAEMQLTMAKVVHDAAKGGQPIKETRTVERADGTVEKTTVEKTASSDWRAALAVLERKSPETWGRRQAVKIEVDWRASLEAAGYDSEAIFEQLVDAVVPLLAAEEDA